MNYAEEARNARKKVLELIYNAQSSHIGSNFSAIDIMTVLFDKLDFAKDKFILSAGWKAASLYYFLWRKGKITEEELNSYCQPGSKFIGLTEPIIPEIPFAGGSMGMGLPAAVGFALSKKLKGEEGMVYVLMSDGELQCGTTWEAALIAAKHRLENLVVLVDVNGFQAMGRTREILANTNRFDVWWSLGWQPESINGHEHAWIKKSLDDVKGLGPTIIFFNTTKGKGVSFMEHDNMWHYKAPNKEEYEKALQELNEI